MKTKLKRNILITGGSSGIGFELAKQLIKQNYNVIICGRSTEKLNIAKKKIPELYTVRCDITVSEEREKLYNEIRNQFGGLNMLFNNAGIVKRFVISKAINIEKSIIEEWKTNYIAPVLLAKKFLPLLIESKGTLINVTSGLAYIPLTIQPNYCATKAALHSMTQSMRVQFSKLGVRVVEMLFPAVDTPFQNGKAPDNAIKPDLAASIALKGLNRGKDEIRIKKARLIYLLSRLIPKKAIKIINSLVPDNFENS